MALFFLYIQIIGSIAKKAFVFYGEKRDTSGDNSTSYAHCLYGSRCKISLSGISHIRQFR